MRATRSSISSSFSRVFSSITDLLANPGGRGVEQEHQAENRDIRMQ